VGAELLARVAPSDEQDRKILNTGVVSDQERRPDIGRYAPQAVEQLFGPGAVKVVFNQHVLDRAEARFQKLQSLPSTESRRTEDQLGVRPFLTEVLSEALRGTASSRRQGPFEIGQGVVGPARLGVSEQVERRSHGSPAR